MIREREGQNLLLCSQQAELWQVQLGSDNPYIALLRMLTASEGGQQMIVAGWFSTRLRSLSSDVRGHSGVSQAYAGLGVYA